MPTIENKDMGSWDMSLNEGMNETFNERYRKLCFSKRLGKSVVVSMMLMGIFKISTKLNSICYFSHVLKYKVKWVKWEK